MRYNKKDYNGQTLLGLIKQAAPQAFIKMFAFRRLLQNPTMAVVFCVSVYLSIMYVYDLYIGAKDAAYHGFLLISLWMTSICANFSEAIAEGRGKAQANALRALQSDVKAKKIASVDKKDSFEETFASLLRVGDLVLLERGSTVPCDGEVVEGIALVDESAMTGESAPVVREAGGDVSALTGGSVIVSDWVVMKVTSRAGEGFLEQMIRLVEGSVRRKTPNEEALHVVLASFTLIFLVVVATLGPLYTFACHCIHGSSVSFTDVIDPFVSIALLVCLIPTTIGALLPAIGIAGMDRMIRYNVLALTPKAVEAAGDVDTLLLDKTGTITLGNRQAAEFIPAPSVTLKELASAAKISSISDETAEGKSIVRLADELFPPEDTIYDTASWSFFPFSAKTRLSGVDTPFGSFRKGALDAIEAMFVKEQFPQEVLDAVHQISIKGGTPLVVTKDNTILGAIFLKDIVKPGLKERFSYLRKMGIKTVMITGDSNLTAAAIAAEAGVDECFGQATPEDKLAIIKRYQDQGHMVAMTGDGSNDAPALAKADVAVAMNSGTQAAREAANMIDLDSDPTKLIEAVGIGKQLLMTRGALTTFSIANDVAKYFVLIPVVFLPLCPYMKIFNIMNLSSSHTATLATVLFNAAIIVALVPLALRGVRYEALDAKTLFCRNLFIWGFSGVIVPFIGIKMFDMVLSLWM